MVKFHERTRKLTFNNTEESIWKFTSFHKNKKHKITIKYFICLRFLIKNRNTIMQEAVHFQKQEHKTREI